MYTKINWPKGIAHYQSYCTWTEVGKLGLIVFGFLVCAWGGCVLGDVCHWWCNVPFSCSVVCRCRPYCLMNFTGAAGFILIRATAARASVCEACRMIITLTITTLGSRATRQIQEVLLESISWSLFMFKRGAFFMNWHLWLKEQEGTINDDRPLVWQWVGLVGATSQWASPLSDKPKYRWKDFLFFNSPSL